MSGKNIEAIYALSPQQQGMLFDTLQISESGVHIEQKIYVLQGKLEAQTLERAWQRVVERHSILRTGFVWMNQREPLQCVLSEVDLSMTKHDWRAFSRTEQLERLHTYLEEDRRCGFELAKPPLMRLALFKMLDDEHHFVWTHHHIVLDGWCRPIIEKEVQTLYEAFCGGEVADLPPALPYRDYIVWLKRQDLTRAEFFWREMLSGISEPTPLGIETTELDGAEAAGFGELRIQIQTATAETLKMLAREHRVTLNTLVQGLWAFILSCYSGSKDVIFGTTVSGRPADLEGADAMLGLFINTLPFRVAIRDGSIWSWLNELQTHHLEMRHHEYCSTGQIHQWCGFPGSLPLYESILVFENYPGNTGVEKHPSVLSAAQTYTVGAQTRYPLNILLLTHDGLELLLVFDRSRIVEATVPRLRDHFLALCDAIITNPEHDLKTLAQYVPAVEGLRIRSGSHAERAAARGYEPPRNACEKELADIWAEVLGVDRVGIHDDFFSLKGHSLLATQVFSRIRVAFNVQLPLRCLFESPTIAALGERIEIAIRQREPSGPPALVHARRDRHIPLSFAQQRLWFLAQLDPDSPSYNIPCAIRLSGDLDFDALERALSTIVDRHESLRTLFHSLDGQPVQVVVPGQSFRIEIADVSNSSSRERKCEALRLLTDAAALPFDLGHEPSFRALLIRLSKKDHFLLLNTHHIVSDGWSMAILFRELGLLYEAYAAGRPSPLPQLTIQYADYAAWQRNWLQGERLDELLAYWKNYLAGASPVLELPLDKPRPPVQGSRGEKVKFALSQELSAALQSYSRREGATLFMTLLAAFQLLVARHAQRDDVVVGTDFANRTRIETEELIGFFVNLLPVRMRLSGNPTFSELLRNVKEVLLEASAFQELPFEKLVEELRPPRDLSRNPLVQVLFVMQNTPSRVLELPGLRLTWLELGTETSRFDLVLFVSENGDQLTGTWLYNVELFQQETITRMSAQFESLLARIVAEPTVRVDSISIVATKDETREPKSKATESTAAHPKGVRGVRRKGISWRN